MPGAPGMPGMPGAPGMPSMQPLSGSSALDIDTLREQAAGMYHHQPPLGSLGTISTQQLRSDDMLHGFSSNPAFSAAVTRSSNPTFDAAPIHLHGLAEPREGYGIRA